MQMVSVVNELLFNFAGILQNPLKINFNLKLTLTCNAPWVKIPTYLDMMNMARSFPIRIEPEALPPGAHFTRLVSFNALMALDVCGNST